MGRRFIIVDDAAFIREVLIQLVLKSGGEVIGEADNGEDAVALVLEKNPDIVIMDIVMPIKSGIQATQEILAKRPNIKILACSTEGSEAMIFRALEAGCIDFITKPFSAEGLKSKLISLMA